MNNGTGFCRVSVWLAGSGGGLFPTRSSFEWFKREHRDELIESGQLILGRGRRPDIVGPDIERLAVEILRREQSKAA